MAHSLPRLALLRQWLVRRCLAHHSVALLALLLISTSARPAEASLLRPVLLLMRPQLENRLSRLCVDTVAAGNDDLARRLQDPCRKLAGPTSRCLIEETDDSGRGLGVL